MYATATQAPLDLVRADLDALHEDYERHRRGQEPINRPRWNEELLKRIIRDSRDALVAHARNFTHVDDADEAVQLASVQFLERYKGGPPWIAPNKSQIAWFYKAIEGHALDLLKKRRLRDGREPSLEAILDTGHEVADSGVLVAAEE